jgi:pimeloyl-ACP methyl ester carboxylesterase
MTSVIESKDRIIIILQKRVIFMFMTFGPPSNTGTTDLKQDMMERLLNDHLVRDRRDVIPTIKVPTMIVMGGKSHFASQLLWDWLHNNLQGSRLEIIQDAGHGFYDSHPEQFKSLVLDFLKIEKN